MKSSTNTPREPGRARWRGIVIFALLLLSPLCDLLAGVLVAPTIVYLSDKNRTGRMIVRNPSNEPKEIEIRMGYGLPVSDSLGNVRVDLIDSAVTDPRSAMEWVRPFPRKLVLPPGGNQTVRFVASPPRDLPDGEYWARIVVKSQESQVNVPPAEGEEGITTNLNMIMQTAISLKYRKGNLYSKLEMVDAKAEHSDSKVNVLVDLINRGNVSYIGVLNCRLTDADNNELSSQRIDLAVYYDLKRRVELPISGIRPKPPYNVEIFITNEGRTDVEPQDRIRGNEIRYSLQVN
jgi:P pilus assembly chaperone PapD